ncbi:MAG: signal peptidase I [Gemmatimonadota bacterium]|nr:signal peptidase I [Gemmatimonadota bacterium]
MGKKRKRGHLVGTANTDAERVTEPKAKARASSTMWEGAKSLLLALALFLVLRSFVIQNFVITSGSMEETLLVGDFLMVNRLALGGRIPFTTARLPGYSEPRRFDVLVFDPPHEDELKLVKRLVGMPGDTLHMEDKVLYINGERVLEPWVRHSDEGDQVDPWMGWQKAYLAPGHDPGGYRPTRDSWGPLIVPEGHYFMLGDNRETSLDSRYWGLLERWRLEGRAVFIYFSYDKESFRPFPWIRDIRWRRIGDRIE